MAPLLGVRAFRIAALALAALMAFAVGGASLAVGPRVENACRDDYLRFCPGYPVGSASLRLCMESRSKQLSRTCVQALIDSGEVDRRRIKRGY